MNFAKDILLIDFETTGGDPEEIAPTQLAAILLDKNTLEEKDSFISYIAADLSSVDPEILAISGITQEDLKDAPSMEEVAKSFAEKFPGDYFLSSWVEYLDRRMLIKMYKAAGIPYKFDYHYLDLWPVAYTHLLKSGYAGSVHSKDMFDAFGSPGRNSHDALEDCRMEAVILRKILGFL